MNTHTRRFVTLAVTLLLTPLAALRAADDLGWIRGANYVPSYARNDIQLWMEFDPAVIDRELGYAERLKLNTVRVFLNEAVFEKQPEKLLADFEIFLGLADKHGLKVMPVLFDSCFDPQVVDVNNYKGKDWIPSPGFPRLGEKDWPAMETFIVAVIGKHRNDKRIVLWDVMNEPEMTYHRNTAEGKGAIVAFVRRALQRVREEKPVQPIAVSWAGSESIHLAADLSDVLILHNYQEPDGLADNIRRIKTMAETLNKPMIINEFAGRPRQPIEKALPVIAREKIGWCFWELMIGSTQFSQGLLPYQGHIYPDGKCFSTTEVAAILNPGGIKGDADEIARNAGFMLSPKAAGAVAGESIVMPPSPNSPESSGQAMKTPLMYFGDPARTGLPFAKDPSVIRFGGRYLMYYSVAAWAKELAPPDAPKGWAIGIAESRDLVNWKKIGEILPEQECERNGIVNGRIILLDGKLHLFYNTYGNGAKDALCHATSGDGLHFARNPTNPVWRPAGDWNNGRAIDVDVVEWGDKLIMYYATRDPAGKIQMLHAIAAPRKSGFSRADWKSLCDGPVLKPELRWEKSCIEAPSVIKRGNTLYLFYGGGYNNAPQQIGCAVSQDGIHFERLFIDKPLLPNGVPGTWNSSESGHPGLFEDDNGQHYLFYQANNDQGRTWFLSWVKIGWDGDRPYIIGPDMMVRR